MTCTFYNCYDNKNKINKTLHNSKQSTCDVINATNIINPQIIVDSDNINYNYVYINDLSRYYFVSDITITNNMIIMQLSIDVMYTYKTTILNSSQYIARVQDYKFTDIKDDMLTVQENKAITTKKISDNIITRNINYILTTR